ncbi:LOW QUALITY PROTEIN: olfactory receptor class A-like protein 4 [Theristicus caerulescens]
MVCNPISIFIYLLAFTGTIGNLIVLFAFMSNAIWHKVLQPLDGIIVNMALVNLLLCCYKEVPAALSFSGTSVFGERGCHILLYAYHMLRLISIWSVENLFLRLIKIHRRSHHWPKFIHRHQGQYGNTILAGCWIFSIVFQLPYLQYNTTAERISSETCHTAQATKILLLLLSIYVVCWLSNDITWIAPVSGLLKHNFENSILRGLYGVLTCTYYSSSSDVIVFGYKKVRRYLTEAC